MINMVKRVAEAMRARAAEPVSNLPSLESVLVGSLGDAWECLARAALASMWSPVETAPPETAVLVWDPVDGMTSSPPVYIAFHDRLGAWWRVNGEDGYFCHPTDWMPLPEPPKE